MRRRSLSIIVRAAIAVIFIVAGTAKLIQAALGAVPADTMLGRVVGGSLFLLASIGLVELLFGLWYGSGIAARGAALFGLSLCSIFLAFLWQEWRRSTPLPCGCLSFLQSAKQLDARVQLKGSMAFNAVLAAWLAASFIRTTCVGSGTSSGSRDEVTSHRTVVAPARAGVTLIELLIVLAIIGALAAILLPVVGRVREHGLRTRCAANLHVIGQAFAGYASDFRGVVPRGARYTDARFPIWPVVLQPYLRGRAAESWTDISSTSVLQCPSHPTADIPTAFVLNAFAFETAPDWKQSPTVGVGSIRNPARLPWVLETPDLFNKKSNLVYDDIFFETHHVIYQPEHLPGSAQARVTFARHRRSSNVLYLDGHVDIVSPGAIRLDDFDDGARNR